MCQSEIILVCVTGITVKLLYYSDKHVILASGVFKIDQDKVQVQTFKRISDRISM